MDVLQDHLVRARASGATFARSTRPAPWGLALSGDSPLAVHAVVQGDAKLWLHDPDRAVELNAGDVALVRGGLDHHLADAVTSSCVSIEAFQAQNAELGDPSRGEANDVFLCGAYRLSGDVGQGLVSGLPDVLVVRPRAGDRIRLTVQLLAWELAEAEAGQQTALDRLLDVLLVHLLRAAFDAPDGDAPRWYQAATDSRLGPALRAIHAHPERKWEVEDLAELSSLSRAAFARAFRAGLDQSPMQYVTDWRMALAREALREDSIGLAAVAERVGYASPYAFAAAFRRHHGVAPGAWREEQRGRDTVGIEP